MENERIIRKVTHINSEAPAKKRVAAYARVSSGKDAMLHSLSAQVSYYNSFIQRHSEWEFVKVYSDEALTGTRADRPGFQELLTDCRSGLVDMVITKSITRFARNTVTMLETLRELKALDVDVWFEKEKIHSMSGDGELMLTILASYSQEESRSASENCKWRLRKSFAEGRPSSTQMLGYQLKDGVFYIVPEEAAIVRQIFAQYLSGIGRTKIARLLTDQGVQPKRGGEWTAGKIAVILQNEKYTGDLLLQKTFSSDHIEKKRRINQGQLPKYYVEEAHEAIIDKAAFAQVQAIIARRKDGHEQTKPGTYPLTGMVECGICHKGYRRKIANASGSYAKPVWICSTFNSKGKKYCPSKQIPEDILEAITRQVLGVQYLSENILQERLLRIVALPDNEVAFYLTDGEVVTKRWENPSRRESWTSQMREKARDSALQRKAGAQ